MIVQDPAIPCVIGRCVAPCTWAGPHAACPQNTAWRTDTACSRPLSLCPSSTVKPKVLCKGPGGRKGGPPTARTTPRHVSKWRADQLGPVGVSWLRPQTSQSEGTKLSPLSPVCTLGSSLVQKIRIFLIHLEKRRPLGASRISPRKDVFQETLRSFGHKFYLIHLCISSS